MSTATNPPAITPDDHLATLRDLASEYEATTQQVRNPDSPLRKLCARRASAIRWLLEQNAYGVSEHEVTL